MLSLIPALPLAGFLINAFVGRRLAKTVSGGLACLVLLASFAVSVASVWRLTASPFLPEYADTVSDVGNIGRELFTKHAFAFEVTSVLILVSMVGAVVLARREH